MKINYEKCMAVTGFNTKQVWVYDNEHDIYIDVPKEVLDDIDSKTERRDWDAKESLLEEVIATNPDWLQDEDYFYNAEETDI